MCEEFAGYWWWDWLCEEFWRIPEAEEGRVWSMVTVLDCCGYD
jgi:hypothetical protein